MRERESQVGIKMFIINCKNYDEIAGEKIIKISKIAEKLSKKYKVPIAIAPPHLHRDVNYEKLKQEITTFLFINIYFLISKL